MEHHSSGQIEALSDTRRVRRPCRPDSSAVELSLMAGNGRRTCPENSRHLPNVGSMLGSFVDGGSALNQHWVSVWCLLGDSLPVDRSEKTTKSALMAPLKVSKWRPLPRVWRPLDTLCSLETVKYLYNKSKSKCISKKKYF